MNKLVYTPFKKAVVVILINDDGEICIVSRKDDHENFGLIGGKVDHEDSLHPTMDETMVAAIRETKEETGLDISNLRLILVYPEGTRMTYAYVADWSGEINTTEPHLVKWGTMEELLSGTYREYNLKIADCLDWIDIPYKISDAKNTI